MSFPTSWARTYWKWRWAGLGPLALGAGCVSVQLAGSPALLLAAALAGLYLFFTMASLRNPHVFVVVLLVALMVLPPLYFTRFGDTPFYVSTLLLPVGLAAWMARWPDFKFQLDPVAKGLVFFLTATGLSLPFALWLSGSEIGTQSILRWLMLAQTALVFFLVRGAARVNEGRAERWLGLILLVAAVVTAGYGVLDFFSPVSIPHPAAPQYIWLERTVLRRAQGVFYEASNFANLCGFFLVVASAAFLARGERIVRVGRPWLLSFIVVLGLAVFVSFSRSAWGYVLVSLLVFGAVSRAVQFRRGLWFVVALGIPLAVLWTYAPELWNYFLNARLGDLTRILRDPDLASSHRSEAWSRSLSILQDYPQYLLFGVGYKTLPYSRLFHEEIITDNGFLNLLLETGILGLSGFLIFSAAVFKTFFRVSRECGEAPAFWSAVLFSAWCGECVQMMAVDAHTFWRNMVVFVAIMAFTINRAEREMRRKFGYAEGPPAGIHGDPSGP